MICAGCKEEAGKVYTVRIVDERDGWKSQPMNVCEDCYHGISFAAPYAKLEMVFEPEDDLPI